MESNLVSSAMTAATPMLRVPARGSGYDTPMPNNVSRKSVQQALDRAAQTIVTAAGKDGRASRADVAKKLQEMAGPERDLVDTFYKFVDAQDAAPGANITKADITSALATAKAQVNLYDTNHDGLSTEERAQMNAVSQLAATVAETFDKPLNAAKQTATVLVSPKWKPDALPALKREELSSSAQRSFDTKARKAAVNDLLAPPIARRLTAGGQTFSIVAQFMHDSFSIELYNANGRKVASGTGWGTPTQPIEWK